MSTVRKKREKQILQAAMQVFINKGYNGATTADIAKQADIAEVTLFRYFPSKKELFLAGIEPILITTLEDSLLESNDLAPIERLRKVLKERILYINENHKIIKLVLMENQVNPEITEFNYIEQVIAILEKALDKVDILLENKELALRFLMGSMLSFLYLPEKDEKMIDNFVDHFIEILSL